MSRTLIAIALLYTGAAMASVASPHDDQSVRMAGLPAVELRLVEAASGGFGVWDDDEVGYIINKSRSLRDLEDKRPAAIFRAPSAGKPHLLPVVFPPVAIDLVAGCEFSHCHTNETVVAWRPTVKFVATPHKTGPPSA